ncbi:unnamed protein product [Lepidochelys kempii]
MLQYFSRTWSNMRIYYTKVYQEIWVGLALTTYAYYKISFGVNADQRVFIFII